MSTRPRYVLSSVTGWPIPGSSHVAWGKKTPPTLWRVLDTAYCHRPVGQYKREKQARAAADRLNAGNSPPDGRGRLRTYTLCLTPGCRSRARAAGHCRLHAPRQ